MTWAMPASSRRCSDGCAAVMTPPAAWARGSPPGSEVAQAAVSDSRSVPASPDGSVPKSTVFGAAGAEHRWVRRNPSPKRGRVGA